MQYRRVSTWGAGAADVLYCDMLVRASTGGVDRAGVADSTGNVGQTPAAAGADHAADCGASVIVENVHQD